MIRLIPAGRGRVDDTIIEAHRSADDAQGGGASHAMGRSKSGRTTNIQAVTDGHGRLVVLAGRQENTSDDTPVQDCIGAVSPYRHLIADKSYDNDALRNWLKGRGTEPVISPRSIYKRQIRTDKTLNRERNRIERSCGRFKDFRRIATRFDRNVKNDVATLCIAAVVVWWC